MRVPGPWLECGVYRATHLTAKPFSPGDPGRKKRPGFCGRFAIIFFIGALFYDTARRVSLRGWYFLGLPGGTEALHGGASRLPVAGTLTWRGPLVYPWLAALHGGGSS